MRRLWVVAALVVAGVGFGAPSVGAAPPQVWSEFSPPAVPPGAQAWGTAQCPDDDSGMAQVSLDGPGANDVAATPVPIVDTRVQLRLGGPDSFGGVAGTDTGTYTFTITCPSDAATLDMSVEVVAPTIDLDAGIGINDCSTSSTPRAAPFGSYIGGCYTYVNPLGALDGSGARVLYVRQGTEGSWQGTSFRYPGTSSPAIPSGAETTDQSSIGPAFAPEVLDLYVVIDDGSGGYAVSALERVEATVTPGFRVVVTSGLTQDSACPEGGGLEERTVAPGTQVWWCYSIESLTDYGMSHHDVVSDVYGPIVEDLDEVISSVGQTFEYGVASAVTVDEPVVNTATWEAEDRYQEYTDGTVAYQGVGRVLVSSSGSPNPIGPGAPTPGAPAAQPVAAAPTYAG